MKKISTFLLFFLINILLLSKDIYAELKIGTGIFDITGQVVERGMLGYGDVLQRTSGIHTRLYTRSFVIHDTLSDKRLVIIVADLGMSAQAIKLETVNRLKRLLGPIYNDDNVMFAVTHTHSGPGGYSHHKLYNITTTGFGHENFEIIVSGIIKSVIMAHKNLFPAEIYFNQGELLGASANRSIEAHNHDPQSAELAYDTNKLMALIKFVGKDGREIGLLNWFSVHPTSISNKNVLISSDNKGYAAYLFEDLKNSKNSDEHSNPYFVAAFANSDQGDSSPNLLDDDFASLDEFERNAFIGTRQFNKAKELYDDADEKLSSLIDYRHLWVDMNRLLIRKEFTNDKDRKLCVSALGLSFIAGSEEDGPSGVPGFREGMLVGDEINKILKAVLKRIGLVAPLPTEEDKRCHMPKPIVFSTGRGAPVWAPKVVPFQLFRIGELVIAGIPGEMTTLSGYKLRKVLKEKLEKIGVKWIVLMGLANTYTNYITTKYEYQKQHYEGASVLYGPYTLSAHLQVFSNLAQSLAQGRKINGAPRPRFNPGLLKDFYPGVIYDQSGRNSEFGDLLNKMRDHYTIGRDIVKAVFRSGHPNNNLKKITSFFKIQRKNKDKWQTVATDTAIDTFFRWKRDFSILCHACSKVIIRWIIPQDAKPGIYRIVHKGYYKRLLRRTPIKYQGTSSLFKLIR